MTEYLTVKIKDTFFFSRVRGFRLQIFSNEYTNDKNEAEQRKKNYQGLAVFDPSFR